MGTRPKYKAGVMVAVILAMAFAATSAMAQGQQPVLLKFFKPADGSNVTSHMVTIRGRIVIPGMKSRDSVVNALRQKGLEVVAFVRPMSMNTWWAQPAPVINPDGRFFGMVYFGQQSVGRGERFGVVLLAVPRGTIKTGQQFLTLPRNSGMSKVVEIKRSR